jgi:ATP-dependent DNA ligase
VQSRRGAHLTRSFPDLAAAAIEQVPEETVLDGEAVVGVDGRLDFGELQKRVASPARATALARERPATFLAFDLERPAIDRQRRRRVVGRVGQR